MSTTHASGQSGTTLACGFTLVELLVAMAVAAISILGCARLVVAGVELEDRARRLQRAAEAIERLELQANGATGWVELDAIDGRGPGCRARSSAATAAIGWRWIEAWCGDERLADGQRAVGRVRLVPG